MDGKKWLQVFLKARANTPDVGYKNETGSVCLPQLIRKTVLPCALNRYGSFSQMQMVWEFLTGRHRDHKQKSPLYRLRHMEHLVHYWMIHHAKETNLFLPPKEPENPAVGDVSFKRIELPTLLQ